jgi:NAD(P)-dependent dehydrogenase (short-subunit alcohol dehydrogenase family)/aminoglycoside phosphotransferase (APT) family kinase protein
MPRQGLAGDRGYENSVTALPDGAILVKGYQRSERFRSEVLALRLLAPAGLSPRLVATCERHQTLAMTRLEALPLAGPLDGGPDSRRLASAIAACLRRLHDIPAPGVGPLGSIAAEPWPCFLRRQLARRLKSLPLPREDAGRLRAHLDRYLASLSGDLAPRMLHHDLKPANILLHGDGWITLCDFDQSRGGDPCSDLGKLWWRTFGGADTVSWRAFLECYGEPDGEADEMVRFYLVVHCIGALAYWHDYARPGYFTHARSAQKLLSAHTGVRCSLQPRNSPETALAAELAAEGHQIIAGGRRPHASSRGLSYLPIDVTDAEAVARFAARAISELGRVDGLVYCAADSGAVGRAWQVDATDAARVLDVTLLGFIRLLAHLVPEMRRSAQGSIIAVGSPAARNPIDLLSAYGAAKAALEQYTRCLASELAGTGVRANVIGISAETQLASAHRAAKQSIRGRASDHPPLPPVTDSLPLARWLLSPDSRHVTGQTIEARQPEK